MCEDMELIIYSLDTLNSNKMSDTCIMSFYPFPKETLGMMYNRYVSEELISGKECSTYDMMQIFLHEHFPEVNVVLFPMELSMAMYKIGDFWIVKPIGSKEARELHRAADTFVDFHYIINEPNTEFEYEGRRARSIVRISI